MLTHPVTLYWHRADQLCFVVPMHFIVSTMQAGTTPIFNIFGMTGPSTNRESKHKSSWSVLGLPYRRLLRSAGATEDLFFTRELHQEPPPCSLPWRKWPGHRSVMLKSTPYLRINLNVWGELSLKLSAGSFQFDIFSNTSILPASVIKQACIV